MRMPIIFVLVFRFRYKANVGGCECVTECDVERGGRDIGGQVLCGEYRWRRMKPARARTVSSSVARDTGMHIQRISWDVSAVMKVCRVVKSNSGNSARGSLVMAFTLRHLLSAQHLPANGGYNCVSFRKLCSC